MAITNQERVGKALDLLKEGLRPFIEREMKSAFGEKWIKVAEEGFPQTRFKGGMVLTDPANLLSILLNEWNRVFEKTLGKAEKNAVHALKEVRNNWAHAGTFSSDEAYRAIDNAGLLLAAVSAPQAQEIEKMKLELLRTRFEEQTRHETRKIAVEATKGAPASGLRSWREIVTPHVDVASGRYQQAEFAADLWQVYLREGSDEYKNPAEFFRRTFLTEGLKQLLKNALLRLSGKGGDPVIELQTNFGGGKTHSMLALYHLFSGTPVSELPGADALSKETGVPISGSVRRVVLVGTKISPGQPHKKPDGTIIRTLWGEMAWQLGGKDGYKLVKPADETGTNPGDVLRELFNRFSPCLILIDEWVAYARQLHEGSDLPAGTFDTQFTFAQALSESAKGAKDTLLVVSIPSSDNEIGGEWGQKALARLKNAIGRVESSWRPASQDEGFEIVRRRLFQPITDPALFTARDAVCRAFGDFYGAQHQEFPPECRESSYEKRMRAAYPIHPEVFDRLYNDWSALDKFQRTRGVLRLMAAVIHSLWEKQDSNLLIMPGTIPMEVSNVQFELTRYMDDPWVPVIEKDVDGPHALPLQLDRDNPNLGRYSACRRVARTIYLGSAPTQRTANKGLDERQVKLGCVQPGESVATFGDALRRLTDRATHLYVDGKRYWYSTQPTVTRLADDRAAQRAEHEIDDEIVRRVGKHARSRGDFVKVHACVASSDVPDEPEARLVILSPDYPHSPKESNSAARLAAAAILASRGNSPRTFRNSLVFLAADATRLKELKQAVRHYLAWESIVTDAGGENPALNLDSFQKRQAETKRKTADETVDARVPEAYQCLLVPAQPDPKGDIQWSEYRLQGQEALAVRASYKLKNEELLLLQLTPAQSKFCLAGVRLRHEIDSVPLWRADANHVGVKQLADDFAKYLYLPRLRDSDVLLAAIRDGVGRLTWNPETFAYAERYDEQTKRYIGLQAGQALQILMDGQSVLVKPQVAARQLEADHQSRAAPQPAGSAPATPTAAASGTGSGGLAAAHPPAPPRRFHGTVRLDPMRLGRDAGNIAEEVVQHLSSILGVNVEITLEIQAEIPDGASPDLIRTITENCRTLRFTSYGFEET